MHKIDHVKQELETKGKVDSLTSLLNRRALSEKADVLFKALERNNKTLAVLFADLNKFKAINDRLGHRAGDQVLAQIAGLIANSVRKSDIAARYGGDEFVIVLPDSDLDKATVLARRLQENLRSWAQGNQFDLSMSIGIGEAPRHGHNLDAVLENVDKAMYRGKSPLAEDGIQRVKDDFSNKTTGTSLQALKHRLREFAHARQWEQFHSPKNLAMALIVEAAEMVEHFQWLSEEQSRTLPLEKLKEVEQEMADIYIYLIRIADGVGIDLEDATWRKIELNEEKYPIEKVRGSAKKYSDY
jgi:diguanylate cyclase (GGDEF)-like protein